MDTCQEILDVTKEEILNSIDTAFQAGFVSAFVFIGFVFCFRYLLKHSSGVNTKFTG